MAGFLSGLSERLQTNRPRLLAGLRNNSNALLGLAGGVAGGQGPKAIGQGLQGFLSGGQIDRQAAQDQVAEEERQRLQALEAQRQQSLALAIGGMEGLPPELAGLYQSFPEAGAQAAVDYYTPDPVAPPPVWEDYSNTDTGAVGQRNAQTGQIEYAPEYAQPMGAAGGAGAFDDENQLRNHFDMVTSPYRTIEESYGRMLASVETPSPAGDLSLLYNYMKMLDPGSVVRESEFATVAATGSLGEQIQGQVQRLINGERLTDSQRQDFVARANQIYQSALANYEHVSQYYEQLAEEYHFNPANIARPAQPFPQAGDLRGGFGGGPIQIQDMDDYAALPSGTPYIGPDGIHRIKGQ